MKLNNDTRLAVLLGKPLKQSYSVRLQNAAYAESDINMVYLAEEVGEEDLEDVLNGLRRMNCAGCGVTKPYKVAVMQYLDYLDPLCGKIGACNTIVNRKGVLEGYNTDGEGFYRSMTEEGGVDVAHSTFFCFGAGGAGRAMCAALAHYGAEKIYITDYHDESAIELCRELSEKIAPSFEFVPYGDYSPLPECNVVLNASGVGMGHSEGSSPMPEELVLPTQIYFDACYNPDKTRFLLNAEKAGARILNGLGMLIWQAAAQVELWTGRRISPEPIRNELSGILQGQE